MQRKLLSLVLLLHASVFLPARCEIIYSNTYLRIDVTPDSQLVILNASGDTLISSILYYGQLIKDTSTHDTIRISEKIGRNRSVREGEAINLTLKGSTEVSDLEFLFHVGSESEEIEVEITSRYKVPVRVIREALIFECTQPVAEVYRHNRILDTSDFQNEYWLGKQGVKFGGGNKTFFVYYTPDVSSLQLNMLRQDLVVNLDYYRDHPFQHFPLLDSAMSKKEDLSNSIFQPGQSRKNRFTIHAGRGVAVQPRLMQSPGGFEAVHVFTEHADWTDLPSHRAVYFGSEDIEDASNVTGGFIKHGIPVTKSVFYANPDNVVNSMSRQKSIFNTPIASIRGTPGFLKLLEQFAKAGNEICLHTPDQYSATRALIDEACAFMKKKFKTVTWIDHGYNNGPKNNREAFVCDGLYATSPSYARDAWEKNGVKYFWNSYYEDFVTPDSSFFDFNGSLMHPYPGFGDAAPAPVYWQHPTRTGSFYSWPTRDLLEMPNPNSWGFHFSPDRLNDMVLNRTVKFAHCYPAGSAIGKGFWAHDKAGKLVIEPEFEKVLAQLALYRDRGLINLTTVRDLLDYWVACEKVRFEYLDDTTVAVINELGRNIAGISFVARSNDVTVEGKSVSKKVSGGDLIFWFDLKAKERLVMKFSK